MTGKFTVRYRWPLFVMLLMTLFVAPAHARRKPGLVVTTGHRGTANRDDPRPLWVTAWGGPAMQGRSFVNRVKPAAPVPPPRVVEFGRAV